MDTADLQQRLDHAVALANDHGYLAACAVVDTSTARLWQAGETTRRFGTASLVKVMVAAYLLDRDMMDEATNALATVMITRSDDDAANELWDRAGGETLEPWVEQRWKIDGLGSANDIDGRWGNTHITASGMARLYAALVADPMVWPWLGRALHAWEDTAGDGSDQRFGLAVVQPQAGIKQGWADGSADDPANAVVHTSGLLDDDRFAVVILTEGHGNVPLTDDCGLDRMQADVVTQVARLVVG